MGEGKIIQGVDIIDLVGLVVKRGKKYQAVVLQQLEEILGADSDEFRMCRKVVLDGLNDYMRDVLKQIFGVDFEGIIK